MTPVFSSSLSRPALCTGQEEKIWFHSKRSFPSLYSYSQQLDLAQQLPRLSLFGSHCLHSCRTQYITSDLWSQQATALLHRLHIFPGSARYSSVKVKCISHASTETKNKLFCESQYSYIPLSRPPNRKMLVQQDISHQNRLVKHLPKTQTSFKSELCHIYMPLCDSHHSELTGF